MKNSDPIVLRVPSMFVRYGLGIILGLNLWLYYRLLTPLTVETSYVILSQFHRLGLQANTILFLDKAYSVAIVPACVAGAAFYLLTLLVLGLRGVKLSKRLKVFGLAALLLFSFNILRIVL
jgi:exosortase/archaeosortase